MILERITGDDEEDVDQPIVPHTGQHGLECVPAVRIEGFVAELNKKMRKKTPLSKR